MSRFVVFLMVVYQISVYLTPINGVLCNKEPGNVENALKKHLLCNGYSPAVHPTQNQTEAFKVDTFLIIYAFYYTDYNRALVVHFKHGMIWNDNRLKWNGTDWNNIGKLYVKPTDIWMPKFKTIDIKLSKVSGIRCMNPVCELRSSGKIACSPRCTIAAACTLDLSNWPYDTQFCKMRISRQTEQTTDRNNFTSRLLCSTELASTEHGDWSLTSLTHNETVLSTPGVANQTVEEYHLTIQRNANVAIIPFHSPFFVLVSLNLFICWLRSMAPERMLLIFISLCSHFGLLQHVIWYFLVTSAPLPTVPILMVSFVLTFILFLVTLVNRWLYSCNASGVIRGWIGTMSELRVTKFILQADYLNLEQEIAGAPVNVKPVGQDCRLLAKLIDRGVLMVVIVIYLIIFCAYIPLQHLPVDGNLLWCYI